MAITLISSPDDFSPLYVISDPWIIQSNLQAQENFKYIFDLYEWDGSVGTFLNRIATYPRPDGNGLYSPHYTLQSFCNTICYATASQIKSNSDSKIAYYFKYAEQYNPGLTFGDTYLISSYVGNKLGLEFRTNISSQILVGDLLTIQKDNIAINPWINGTASVIGITNSTLAGYSKTVFLDKNLPSQVQFSSDESGTITNIFRASPTQSQIKYGWNAARQYDDFSNFENTYVMKSSPQSLTASFLSSYETAYLGNLTQKKPIYSNEYETLDLITATSAFSIYPNIWVRYSYYNSAGGFLGQDDITLASVANGLRYTIPSGTANIKAIGGSGSQFLNNGTLSSYKIRVGNGPSGFAFQIISGEFNYEIKENCRPYEVIRLAFLNKLGGYDYWSFNLVSRYTREVQRKEINRALSPTYTIGDRGRDVIYGSGVENWVINSDFLTDDDALFIRELVETTSAYLIDGVNLIPIIITDKNWVYKSGLLDGYVQYTLNFEKSNDIIFNR